MTTHRTLRQVIGESVRRLREAEGKRQEDLSAAARKIGLAWPRSKIASLERGEKAVSIEELLLLPLLLDMALDREITFSELFPDPDVVVPLSPKLSVKGSELAAVFGAGYVPDFLPLREELARSVDQFFEAIRPLSERLDELGLPFMKSLEYLSEASIGLAEERAAQKLNENKIVVTAIALRLWGRSLSEERDARVADAVAAAAPASTIKAKRGRVTRELVAEIQAYIANPDPPRRRRIKFGSGQVEAPSSGESP